MHAASGFHGGSSDSGGLGEYLGVIDWKLRRGGDCCCDCNSLSV